MKSLKYNSLFQIKQIDTVLFIPHNIGNIEVLFTNSNVLIYGLQDSQMQIFDPKISLDKPIFEYHVHFCSKNGSQLVSGDFRRVATDESCTKIITCGLDNVIVKHRFRYFNFDIKPLLANFIVLFINYKV